MVCEKCERHTYSFNISISCAECPSEKAECFGGADVQLKKGYWRISNMSIVIVECENLPKNCKGEPKSYEVFDPNHYCSEGLIGPLCETCDI